MGRCALPILLGRLLHERLAPDEWPEFPEPIKTDRTTLAGRDEAECERLLTLAAGKIGRRGGILVLFDADDDCPATLGPSRQSCIQSMRSDVPVSVVLAMREYEAWLLAAAESLGMTQPERSVELIRDAKGEIKRQLGHYRPTVDQPALTRTFSMTAASSAGSFDKLSREVQRLLQTLRERGFTE